jgi:hypothetical protein
MSKLRPAVVHDARKARLDIDARQFCVNHHGEALEGPAAIDQRHDMALELRNLLRH